MDDEFDTDSRATSSKNRSLQLQTNGSFKSHHKIKKIYDQHAVPWVYFIYFRSAYKPIRAHLSFF